jgi:hypothetical protein
MPDCDFRLPASGVPRAGNNTPLRPDRTGESLEAHHRTSKTTFSGSIRTKRSIITSARHARRRKPKCRTATWMIYGSRLVIHNHVLLSLLEVTVWGDGDILPAASAVKQTSWSFSTICNGRYPFGWTRVRLWLEPEWRRGYGHNPGDCRHS